MGRTADGYTIAKLRARIGLMRDSQLVDNMIKAPTLTECVNALSGSRHSGLVDVYTRTGDLQQMELALFSEEVASYREIAKDLSGYRGKFLYVLLEKLEIENLKNALRLWYSDSVRHHSIRYRASYLYKEKIVNDIDWDGIINASEYANIIKSVENTPYKEVLSLFSYEVIASKGLFDLEIALDQYYFKHLFTSISRLGRDDRSIAYKLYAVDVDLKNILLLIRYSYYHNLPKEELESIILPYGNIYKAIARASHMKSDDLIIYTKRIIAKEYPDLMQEIEDIRRSNDDLMTKDENARQILLIENYLGSVRKKEYSHMLVSDPFSIGIILAYFFLSGHEDGIIRAILSAKYYKWNEEKIREAIAL